MASPFYRNHWNPIRHGYYPQVEIQAQATKPKIVNIPVHFVGSDGAASKQSPAPATVPTEETRIAAAITIQRAVRGLFVRKNARVVRQVAAEVEEIERKVREGETKIRLDSRERLLVSETLMALLLRLDAVRGVRDFRKRVIRRVVNLQEVIDSISAAAEGPLSVIGMSEDQKGLEGEGCEHLSGDHENREDQTCNQDEEMKDNEPELEVRIPLAVESSNINSHPVETVDGTISESDPADDLDVSGIEVTEEALMDHENAANQTIVLQEENKKVETELEIEIPAEVESPVRQSDLISGSNGMAKLCSIAVGNEGAIDVAEESSMDHEKKSTQTLNLEEDTNEAEAVSEVEI
ncbi:uncharacterized protein LOC110035132, partial [Phalaenopsis equestris]|uniref:uncharacterized protein LOC110035132 n=1 Tax=Phalaenopsis equestris TaxID=78828 RepID=UPI0009E6491C